MSTLDISVSSADAGYNNRQTSAYSCVGPPIAVRNISISEPGVSSSDADQRLQPQPNRFRSYPCAFHRVPHSTECHRPGRRHCNTVSLEVPVPGRLACFRWFARARHPNSAHNAWLDPLSSGCRFRFFLLQKGVQLIQFSLLRLFGYGCRRQFIYIIANPIRYTLLTDFQYPADGPLAVAFHVESDGKHACVRRVAFGGGLRCINSITFTTAISLTTRRIEPGFVLLLIGLASWTFHALILMCF